MAKVKAFTMIELLVSIALIGIIAAFSGSAIINYYRTSITDSELRQVTARLQIARQNAIGNATGSDYSVKFLSSTYVIFPGDTYSSSDPENKSYALETSVLVSSSYTDDIITFTNFTGRTGVAGTVTMSAYGITSNIIINELGIVEDIN